MVEVTDTYGWLYWHAWSFLEGDNMIVGGNSYYGSPMCVGTKEVIGAGVTR